ncbi:hypothetical protein HLG78_00715 [Candidatus Absconditicoccus praedator]|nr:hypothetical protein HLG78_00715 [Candidatus Absconditicoccus praedator]
MLSNTEGVEYSRSRDFYDFEYPNGDEIKIRLDKLEITEKRNGEANNVQDFETFKENVRKISIKSSRDLPGEGEFDRTA